MWVKSFSVFGHRLISVIFVPSSYPRDLSFWKQVPNRTAYRGRSPKGTYNLLLISLYHLLIPTYQHSTFPLPLAPFLCRYSPLSSPAWNHLETSYSCVDCRIQTILNALFVCASYPSELFVCFLDTPQILNIGGYTLQNFLTTATSTEISIPGRSRKRPCSWANGVISIIHTLRVEGIIQCLCSCSYKSKGFGSQVAAWH